MKLVRADCDTNVFSDLERQWAEQCEQLGENYEDFSTVYIEHARGIVDGKLNTDKLAIYVLQTSQGAVECLAHINVAPLPRTTGRTLRIRSILFAPKYDYLDIQPEIYAHLGAELIENALYLASGEEDERMAAEHVKICLTNSFDRAAMAPLATRLGNSKALSDVSFRGNWLHFSLVQDWYENQKAS